MNQSSEDLCKDARAAYQSAFPDGPWHADGGETDAPIRAAIAAYLASPQPTNPAQVTDAMVDDAKLAWNGPDYIGLTDDLRAALTAAIGAGRSSEPEFETAPDNGTPAEVLAYVLECARRWVPEARIIGNARAGDIERAIAAIGAGGQAVAVKPLEWDPFRAETPFGYYHVDDQSDRSANELEGRPPFLLTGSRINLSRHPTLEAARAAAQVDFERRILSAIAHPVPMGWRLVPEEPTDEMLDAAIQAHEPLEDDDDLYRAEFKRTYRAMLAAVPTYFAPVRQSKAADDVLSERQRQVEAEGWTPEHDDAHARGEMLTAACCYIQHHVDDEMFGDRYDNTRPAPAWWPWDLAWWKPKSRRRDLVRAAALLLAEIERLDRLPAAPQPKGE